jgi:hypothetical protein
MMQRLIVWICLLMLVGTAPAWAETPLPRTVFVLYDSKEDPAARNTAAHRFAEMPLNYLGFTLEYYDANQKLPEFRPDVKAVLTWFESGAQVNDSEALITWLNAAIDEGKKLIIIGEVGANEKYRKTLEGQDKIRRLLRRVGVEDNNGWFNITYRAEVVEQDYRITGFERKFGGSLPPYYYTTTYGKDARSHLKIKNYTTENTIIVSDLIITHPNGAYIADGYAKFEIIKDDSGTRIQQWYIDPFTFFADLLDAHHTPRPDVSTINGRRIFYSHMDGDGWNNLSEVDGYNQRKTLSSDVLRQEIFARYSHIPFSVSIIVNELEEGCYGVPGSKEVAQRIFELPNVEPTSHTYSHPLYWGYFADGDPAKERRFLKLYPPRPESARSIYSALYNLVTPDQDGWDSVEEKARPEANRWLMPKKEPTVVTDKDVEQSDYETPRSYACSPFDIKQEIQGSIEYVRKLAPPGKQVKLIQWSGNTSPYEEAIRLAREVNVLNINGGDTRLDREYPSYAYVAPIGVQVGKERQIYSSNSNENTYTNLWTDRFFGFQFLTRTARNTETPRRLMPFNVYFHTYSGSKKPSLEAIKTNLDYALAQDIIPVFTSDYAQLANDFYRTGLIEMGPSQWRVENRGTLNTIRFDEATLATVDWIKSQGVVGQRHLHGSLYVALDAAVEKPVIALNQLEALDFPVKATRPYLIRSRWKIKDLHYFNNLLTFAAEGFGSSGMEWYWPEEAKLAVKIQGNNKILFETIVQPAADGIVRIDTDINATEPVEVSISPLMSSQN